MKKRLKEVGNIAEEIKDPMERALVDPPKKSSLAMEEAVGKLKQWASSATDIWNRFGEVAVGALDGMSDALANFVVKGKADFNALAESILMDLTRVIIRAQMAQGFEAMSGMGGIFGSIGKLFGGVPSAQSGGEVAKTGLAVIHKGETFSGVDGGGGGQKNITLNVNVSAIDAAGTYQFLQENKRNIATMIQDEMDDNHPIRRNKGWK